MVSAFRGSYRVRRMPSILSVGLTVWETVLIVSIKADSPSSAKYSHCMVISTESAATSAFSVSILSDGGQSIITKSYKNLPACSAVFSRCSRFSTDNSATSAAVRSPSAGTQSIARLSSGVATSESGCCSTRSSKAVAARSPLCRPTETVAFPCGSKSISSARLPIAASAAERLTAVVVLPTPPF